MKRVSNSQVIIEMSIQIEMRFYKNYEMEEGIVVFWNFKRQKVNSHGDGKAKVW